MSKHLLLLAALGLAATTVAYAQNTFPASGYVGIGTTTPDAPLAVNGNVRSFSWQPYGSTSDDFFVDVEPNTRFLRTRNWNTGAPNIAATGIHTGAGFFEGYVGIGTTSPVQRLHVMGNIALGSPFESEKSIEAPSQDLRISGGWDKMLILGHAEFSNYGGRVVIPGGNVGIGTTNPSGRLSLGGGGLTGKKFYIYDSGASTMNSAGFGVDMGCNPYSSSWFFAEGMPGYVGRAEIGSLDSAGSFTARFVVRGDGNVGIGTTNPSEKLSVNGKIRAKEVIVDTNWSDYVFNDSYKLQSLTEVEQHIKTQKHLPGVPSAQEVAAKGVSVGDMQAILLAKIEELTLHQIAQEKELKAQRAEINALKVENAQLKAPTQSSISAN